MTKQEFLSELKKALSGLSDEDIKGSLEYYSEMIDDRVEDGISEEEAVADLGSIDEIAKRILMEIPLPKLIKSKVKPKRKLSGLEITVIILGFPLWFPLLVAAFAVALSLYAVLWSVIISFWAVFAALVGASVGGLVSGIVVTCVGNVASSILTVGAAIACAGLSIFAFFGCGAATKGGVLLTKKIALGIKKCFIGKEGSK